jgi:hypothetical protein
MARGCAVCLHPQLEKINQALVARQSHASLAKAFHVSDDSVDRHVSRGHLVIAAPPLPKLNEDLDIVGQLRELIGLARRIMQRAEETDQLAAATNGVKALVQIFELMARLTGQLDSGGGTQVNVLIQQQQKREADQELQLSRLTVEERCQLRYLYTKMQSELPVLGGTDGNRSTEPLS